MTFSTLFTSLAAIYLGNKLLYKSLFNKKQTFKFQDIKIKNSFRP